jgi:dipeptidyl aminopeptidase/acylaminoacyl peptidase
MGRDNEKGKGFASHEEIWLLDLDSLRLESLTRSLGLGSSRRVYYDLRGPGASEPAPVWDGDEHIYFPVSKGGRYSLYRYSMKTGFIEPILDGEYVVWDYDVRNNIIVYIKTSSTEPLEIWMLEPGKEPVKITRFNDLIKEYKVSEPKHFIFTASDGAEIEGWVIEPVDREEGRRYPAILWIHGGPKSKFGWSFMFEFQLYASNGYAVIYCNPRGSDGYSEDFADIRGHYGERDYQDIIECLDQALKRFDFIDPERIGVTGISYGGFMTNWIITQTDRFKATVSQNGISIWDAEYLTTDIGVYFVPDQLKGDPWREWERLRAKSPLYYVDSVKTPLMIIHSIDDYRCWLDQAIAMFTALKTKGKETELILFEEGGHVFGWSGRPRLREARLNNMLRWFDKHLKK